jgi:hypothetical protein
MGLCGGWECATGTDHDASPTAKIFNLIDFFFTIVFTIELTLNLAAHWYNFSNKQALLRIYLVVNNTSAHALR